jgi:hypothetical protein
VDWTGLLRIVVFVHLNGPAVWASSKWYVWVEPKPEPARAGLGRPGQPNEKKTICDRPQVDRTNGQLAGTICKDHHLEPEQKPAMWQ